MKEHIKLGRSRQTLYLLLRGSLIGLPYASYVGLLGLIAVTLTLAKTLKQTVLDTLTRNGLLLITGLLLLSCLVAENRGEAFLQLTNFLPFFLFFAVVPVLLNGVERLEQLAIDLVITTLPINAAALIEYLLRADFIPKPIRQIPIVAWVRDRPHEGRATVMFNHPNALASYLVLILGLGLGLILCNTIRKRSPQIHQTNQTNQTNQTEHLTDSHPLNPSDPPHLPNPPNPPSYSAIPRRSPRLRTLLVYVGTYSTLIGIFCSGSRNGLVVAVLQLTLFAALWGLFVKVNRTVLFTSLISLGGILAGAAWFGIGGRSLSPTTWADDPRLRLWTIAFDLIHDRPWLGWGLGNYKFQFPSRLLELYPSCFAVRTRRIVPVECADVTHAHNFWLMLTSEAGLLVAIALTLWVGYICVRGVRSLLANSLKTTDKALLLGYLLSFMSCVGFAVFDVTLYDARVNALNWTILAGIYCFTTAKYTRSNCDR